MDAHIPSPARTPFGFGALALPHAHPALTARLAVLARVHRESRAPVAVGGNLALALWSRDVDFAAAATLEPAELLTNLAAGLAGADTLGDALVESTALGDASHFYAVQLTDDWDEFVEATTRLEAVRAVRQHALDALTQIVDITLPGLSRPYRLRLLRPAGLALSVVARVADAPPFLYAGEWGAAAAALIELMERQRHAMFADVWTMQHAFAAADRPDVRGARRQAAANLVIEFLHGTNDDEAVAELRARCDTRGPLPFHPARVAPAITWLEQAALALAPEWA